MKKLDQDDLITLEGQGENGGGGRGGGGIDSVGKESHNTYCSHTIRCMHASVCDLY